MSEPGGPPSVNEDSEGRASGEDWSDELVTVATFALPTEAAMARGRLEADGIEAYLDNEHLVATYSLLTNATGGVKVTVPARDLERARAILASRHELDEADRDDEDDGYADEPYRCPRCHRKDVDLAPLPPALLIVTLLLLGIPFLFLPRTKHCRACGHVW